MNTQFIIKDDYIKELDPKRKRLCKFFHYFDFKSKPSKINRIEINLTTGTHLSIVPYENEFLLSIYYKDGKYKGFQLKNFGDYLEIVKFLLECDQINKQLSYITINLYTSLFIKDNKYILQKLTGVGYPNLYQPTPYQKEFCKLKDAFKKLEKIL